MVKTLHSQRKGYGSNLVGEVRSYMPPGTAKKQDNNNNKKTLSVLLIVKNK